MRLFLCFKIIPIFGTVILCTLNAAIHAEARAKEILSGGRFKKRHFRGVGGGYSRSFFPGFQMRLLG